MVGHYYVAADFGKGVDVVEQTLEDVSFADFQQRLGKILCKGIESGCITSRNYYIFHRLGMGVTAFWRRRRGGPSRP